MTLVLDRDLIEKSLLSIIAVKKGREEGRAHGKGRVPLSFLVLNSTTSAA
jgi:hypothetical protein